MNRRARTLSTIPVRHNRIFEIFILEDGYTKARVAYYFARKNSYGPPYTGPVDKMPRG